MSVSRGESENNETSPYLGIFQSIEARAWEEKGLSPLNAYVQYDSDLLKQGLDPLIYLSTALTSGGFARDIRANNVYAQNAGYGVEVRKALLEQHPLLSTRDILLPAELGKVYGWSQTDYLHFWFHVIVGLPASVAEQVSAGLPPMARFSSMNDVHLPHDQRKYIYEDFTSEYVDQLYKIALLHKRGSIVPSNIQALVGILDPAISLGSYAEARLARATGIPPQTSFFNSDILALNPELRRMTSELRRLGASAVTSNINRPGMSLVGVSTGNTYPNLGFQLGFRKAGLMNVILDAEYYSTHPSERPPRHQPFSHSRGAS